MKKVNAGCLSLFLAGIMTVCTGCAEKNKAEDFLIWKETSDKEEIITLEAFVWEDEETNIRILAEEWSARNPEVIIHLNSFPSTEYSQQMMAIRKETKTGDCVFFPHLSEAAVWIEKGIVQTLEPYIQTEEMNFTEWYQEEEKAYDSYILPYRVSRWAVFYNTAMFEERGIPFPQNDWTWEDYANIAVRLTNRIGTDRTYGSMSYEPTSIWWRVPARTRGANDPLKEADLEMFRESLEWCYRLTYELGAQLPYTEQTGNHGRLSEDSFLDGEVGMFFSGDWSVATLNDRIREKELDFVYDIAPLPGWEEEERYCISDAAVVAMTATTAYPEETADFIRFVCSEEGALILAKRGIIPAWDSEDVRDTLLNLTESPMHMENFFAEGELSSIPATVTYTEAMEIVRDEAAAYLLREQSIDQCFENIQKELKRIP